MLTRRQALSVTAPIAFVSVAGTAFAATPDIEQWGLFEARFDGPAEGNPFIDVTLSATFRNGDKSLKVPGFYDGDGVYRLRFSPPSQGLWTWTTRSNAAALNGKTGTLRAGKPAKTNHGPVQVSGYHFTYADGTPYRQIGTTSYAWAQQSDARVTETLRTLSKSPFNKMRMCVFPNVAAKPIAPFAITGTGDRDWDPTRPNPAFFRRFEDRVTRLLALGIEADIIIYQPYDEKRGYSDMARAHDEIYLRYLMARLSAFRNVWWSLANEFDLVKTKSTADWDHLFQLIQAEDPYSRLRSIHNLHAFYDHRKPWVTHSSVQNGAAVLDASRAQMYRDVWEKPVIYDEICYEGDSKFRWGNLTPQQMVSGFWHALVGGTYVGHSETYAPDGAGPDESWLGKGGTLKGQSAPRLAFLKKVMEDGPAGIDPVDKYWERHIGGQEGQYYLRYFGEAAPKSWAVKLPHRGLKGGEVFRADILDTWNMTVTPVEGTFTMSKIADYDFGDPSRTDILLPGMPYMAVRLIRVDKTS